jgi:hypothetical protein
MMNPERSLSVHQFTPKNKANNGQNIYPLKAARWIHKTRVLTDHGCHVEGGCFKIFCKSDPT